MRVSRGLGVLFGELTLPLYLFTGRWRHLLLAAGLEFLEFAVYSSLTVTVGSSV